VRLGQAVTDVFADGVEVGGERLHSYNVIWAAGVRASALVDTLGVPVGPGGRVVVMPDCSVPGYPQVFVIGDAAYLVDSKSNRPVPGVSQGALQMGRFVARVIAEDLKGSRAARDRGFHYVDWGSMATIGKSRAVVEIGPLRFGGLLAWLAWMFLHVSVLIGFRNRIAVMTSWIYGYVFSRRGSRLITRSRPLLSPWRISPILPAAHARGGGQCRGGGRTEDAARLLRRFPLQPPRARARMAHQPGPDGGAWRTDPHRRSRTGRGGLHRLAHRGRRGRGRAPSGRQRHSRL
jgi:hypothetical protein